MQFSEHKLPGEKIRQIQDKSNLNKMRMYQYKPLYAAVGVEHKSCSDSITNG